MSETETNPYLANDTYYSLNKFVGKKIADILGFPADPFGGTPVFEIKQLLFDDGSTVWVEGEHDTPYLPSDESMQNMDEDTLQKFIDADKKG